MEYTKERKRKIEKLEKINELTKLNKILDKNRLKSKSKINHYLQFYYILNGMLILLYPVHRAAGLNSESLEKKDWLGYSREKTILATFALLSLLRYRKYCTTQHAIVMVLFYAKICILSLYYIIAPKFFIVYSVLLISESSLLLFYPNEISFSCLAHG